MTRRGLDAVLAFTVSAPHSRRPIPSEFPPEVCRWQRVAQLAGGPRDGSEQGPGGRRFRTGVLSRGAVSPLPAHLLPLFFFVADC